MPQISQLAATYASQIFWMLLFFGLIFFVIGRSMVPNVMATVETRDKQIADDLAAAEAARRSADEQEEAWRVQSDAQRDEAQAVIAKAKADAAVASEKSLVKANAKIDASLSEAEVRITAAQNKAQKEIEVVAAEAASDIVARLTGAKVDGKAASNAVKELLHG